VYRVHYKICARAFVSLKSVDLVWGISWVVDGKIGAESNACI
jgi:hypothetical protein